MITEPGREPAVVRRSTSAILPAISREAPSSAIRAATGSPSARPMASPILIASETEPRTVATPVLRRRQGVIGRAGGAPELDGRGSFQAFPSSLPETVQRMRRLPRSSVITAGLGEMPARCIVTWVTREKRVPCRRRPRWEGPAAGPGDRQQPLPPPISPAMSAANPAASQEPPGDRGGGRPRPVFHLLDADRGSADAAARHDQVIVRQFHPGPSAGPGP